jgi:hypothetical protein
LVPVENDDQATGVSEPGEVRQLALGHHPLGDGRVLAVEADEDGALDQRFRFTPVTDHPPRGAEGPREDRNAGQEHGHEDHGEGPEDREAGAGTDVGVGRGRNAEEQHHRREGDPHPGGPGACGCRRHALSVSFYRRAVLDRSKLKTAHGGPAFRQGPSGRCSIGPAVGARKGDIDG